MKGVRLLYERDRTIAKTPKKKLGERGEKEEGGEREKEKGEEKERVTPPPFRPRTPSPSFKHGSQSDRKAIAPFFPHSELPAFLTKDKIGRKPFYLGQTPPPLPCFFVIVIVICHIFSYLLSLSLYSLSLFSLSLSLSSLTHYSTICGPNRVRVFPYSVGDGR